MKYPGYAITATPPEATGRASVAGVVLAESERCLVVAESDHLDQLYFPRADVRWEHLAASTHHTICPFKGQASYWSVADGGADLADVAWSYEDPFEEVAATAGYVAFYVDRVDVTVTEHADDGSRVSHRFPV